MGTIEIIQYGLAVVVGLVVGYPLLLSIFALRGKKNINLAAVNYRKFAIVLFAQDEDSLISRSLYSLSGLVYPKNLYDLIVIVDNYSDKSAVIANKLGAIVLGKSDKKSKNVETPYWAFNQILQWDNYDAIVAFDSNSLVSGNYLEVMNYYLDRGSKIIQSNNSILPQQNSWKTHVTRIHSVLYNYVNPLGRKSLGLNTMLRGNGMCFSADTLLKNPWPFTPIDEYGINLQLKGYDIDFAPEATVWTEVSSARKNDRSGQYLKIWKYAPRLFIAAFKQQHTLKFVDILINLITPSFVAMIIFILGMWLVSISFWGLGMLPLTFVWIWSTITALATMYLVFGLTVAEADQKLYKAIFYIPIFAVWKIKVYFQEVFLGDQDTEKEIVPAAEENDIMSGGVGEL